MPYTLAMDEFLKMDIFFAVATAATVVVAGFAAYALWRLARVLRHVEHISEQVSAESDAVRADLAEMRSDLRRKGLVKSLVQFLVKSRKP